MRASFFVVFVMLFILTFVNSAQADPPIIGQQIDRIVVDEDCGRVDIVNLNDVFVDPDGRQLVFSFQNAPRDLNMEIDRNGLLFFEPSDNYNIPDGVLITIVAANAQGEASETRFRLVIFPVNDSPTVVNPIDDIMVDEDCGLVRIADLDDVFVDIDGDDLTYSFENDVEELNMGIDDDNSLFFDPDLDFNLEDGVEIMVTAEDGDGETVSDIFWLTIWGNGPGWEVIGDIEDLTIDEDAGRVEIVDLTEIFADEEDDQLDYEIVGAPAEAGMQIENINLLFLEADQDFNLPDGAEITIVASDDEGLTAEETFILTITPVNDAPIVLAEIDDRVVDQNPGMTIIADLDDIFFDIEGDELIFDFQNAPDELNMRIGDDSILSFNPDENFAIPDGVEITVVATDQGEMTAEIEFMLTIIPLPAVIEVSSEELDFGEVIVGEERGLILEIFNAGGEILSINDIITSSELFSIDRENAFDIEPRESIEIDVIFRPDNVGEYNEGLTIFSNDQEAPEFVVDLIGVGLEMPPPEMVVDPMAFDFGEVLVGAERTFEMLIRNEGFMDLDVEDIEVADQVFRTDFGGEIILERGEALAVTVIFAPEEAVNYESVLTIVSNDGGQGGNVVEVNLRGTGIEEQEPGPHYRFVETGESHAIAITSATLNGEDLEARDEIAVFTPGGICAGAILIDPGEDMGLVAWGDDPQTDIVEGFQNGEQLNFRYWDFAAEIEIMAEIDRIIDGQGVWQRDGFTILSLVAENEPELVEQVIELNAGWNMISLNIIPVEEYWEREEGPDVILMLEQIQNQLIIAKDENGRFYIPEFGFCNIPFWDLQAAFQIKVEEDSELRWLGIPIPEDQEIQLAQGWNLLAYTPAYELDASSPDFYVLSPIIENVIVAKNSTGRFMTPEFNFSNMAPWRPGQGYQINVDDDVEFVYPPEREEELAFSEKFNPEHSLISPLGSTGANMSLLLNDISGKNVQPGDIVSVLSSDNTVVGQGIIDQNFRCGLAVWGDDEFTDRIDGMRDEETFSLVLSSNNDQCEIMLSEVLMGSGLKYKTDEFTVLNVTVKPPLPEEFYISSAYPNPFNSTTRISYGLPEDAEVSIQIYDITGCLVETLVSGKQFAGHYSVSWNAGSNPTGVYLIRLETEQFSRVTKFILAK